MNTLGTLLGVHSSVPSLSIVHTPLKFNMGHLKMSPWQRRTLFGKLYILFQFQVKLWGCNIYMHFCPTKKLTNNTWTWEMAIYYVSEDVASSAHLDDTSLLSDQRVSSTCDVGKWLTHDIYSFYIVRGILSPTFASMAHHPIIHSLLCPFCCSLPPR